MQRGMKGLRLILMRPKRLYRDNIDNMYTQKLIDTIKKMSRDFGNISELSGDEKIINICNKYKNKNPISWG